VVHPERLTERDAPAWSVVGATLRLMASAPSKSAKKHAIIMRGLKRGRFVIPLSSCILRWLAMMRALARGGGRYRSRKNLKNPPQGA
jgi:hypothetical protein